MNIIYNFKLILSNKIGIRNYSPRWRTEGFVLKQHGGEREYLDGTQGAKSLDRKRGTQIFRGIILER